MRIYVRRAAGITLLVLCAVAVALASSTNYVQKYNGSGMVDSAIYESGGNVGIGTSSPNRKLELAADVDGLSFEANTGSPNSGAIRFGDSSGWKLHFGRSRESIGGALNAGTSGVLMTIQDTGNVGIGTTSPDTRLKVISASPGDGVRISGTGTASPGLTLFSGATEKAGFGFALANGHYATNAVVGDSVLYNDHQDSGSLGKLHLATGSGPAARLTVDGSGNVGIGTISPAYRLHVVGNVYVDGNIAAKYQDVAEWVPASEPLAAGTVVVLNATTSNQVTSSSVSYDTRVAGVVSERPGIALGEKSADKLLVATTGRVRVKVDASKRPIHIGDLLVTSDVPGVAMTSEPVEFMGRKMHMPGTLIGKALEPLASGKGQILVLLSLQ